MNLGPGLDKTPRNASHTVRQALRPPPADLGVGNPPANPLWFKAPGLQLTQTSMLEFKLRTRLTHGK